MDIELTGQAPDGTEPGAGGATRGVAIIQAAVNVSHPATAVDGEHFDYFPGGGLQRLQQQLAAPPMPNQVGGQFGRDDCHPARQRRIEAVGCRETLGIPARFPNLAFLLDHVSSLLPATLQNHFQLQRTIVTFVPLVEDSIAKSLTRRRAPESPSPRPLPEVQPSVRASSRFGMPGP